MRLRCAHGYTLSTVREVGFCPHKCCSIDAKTIERSEMPSFWSDRERFEVSALCLGGSDRSGWPVWCGTGGGMAVAAIISDCNSTFSRDTASFGICSWTSAAVWRRTTACEAVNSSSASCEYFSGRGRAAPADRSPALGRRSYDMAE